MTLTEFTSLAVAIIVAPVPLLLARDPGVRAVWPQLFVAAVALALAAPGVSFVVRWVSP